MRTVRWTQQQATVAGVRLAWQRAGTGPPVVYLHDAGADTLASPAFDDLAADHDVVLVDLPGYGRSGDPAGVRDAGDVAAALHD
ncbi:MAG: alpha/beta hydrolase, partial [Actinomycetota bacterium]|nr:alpha/beta hydrolase [Actinomycetota bacterium]